jgi:septum formation protein
MNKIVLASRSPRRKLLLEWAELAFDVLVRETEELFPEEMPADDVPVYIAHNKAVAVRQSPLFHRYEDDAIVIGADTVVVLDGRIIGKPLNREEAIATLSALSGKKHEVITGVSILSGDKEIQFADKTAVWFHSLSQEQIAFYVDKYQPYDKAGAYAIQEWIGVVGIEKIEGDFYNVMGLPVSRVLKALEDI